jgi:hypothetical protein
MQHAAMRGAAARGDITLISPRTNPFAHFQRQLPVVRAHHMRGSPKPFTVIVLPGGVLSCA